ncbi:Purple acid phosphatase 17 [Sesamum angolense]|uniref:acid phosphatase n=1 Tax=Sesamum angolense TaxID=2727404 RepID=A0AAE1WM02_9LAMI|nr:Purple acid phosphatase 17 [Sesamum angolense]
MDMFLWLVAIITLLSARNISAEFQRFEHPTNGDGTLRFLVVGDWGRKGEFNQSRVAFQMGRIGEELDIDFVVSTGDNFYDDGLKGEDDPNFLHSFANIYTANSLQKQWFAVLGNHDYRGDAMAQLSPFLRKVDSRWLCFRSFVVDAEIGELFFVDTTPFVSKYFTKPGHHKYDWRDVLPVNNYTSHLLSDLEGALKESRAKWKIVVGHHPIRSVGHHGDTKELVDRLLPILQANKVDFYVNGHDHCLEHISDDESTIQFLTSGGGSKAWRGDSDKADGLKFFNDGQGFMSVQLTQSNVEIVLLCLKPNNLIANERRFQAKSGIIAKPRFEFNRISFRERCFSSKLIRPLEIESSRRRRMVKKANDAATIMLTSGGDAWCGAAPESSEKCGGKDEKSSSTTGKVVRVPAAMVPRKSAAAAVDKEVAARRALAIKRVLEDNEDNRDTSREFSLFVTSRGDTIFTQSWTPVKVQVRGMVVLLHGLNEHSGRYNAFAKKLNANGFKVYGMDWIGHGGSDGLHAYVPSLDYAVNDMKTFLSKVLAENPGLPCFCFGHSQAVLDPKVRQSVAGVVLTSPAVGVQPSHPIFAVSLLSVLDETETCESFHKPPYKSEAKANKRGVAVSRDAEALVAKYSDPLVFTGSIRIRTGYEILRITAFLQQNLSKLTVPFLVLHGTADSVTDPTASQKLYDEASSTDKTINLYEGLLHDLLFEPEKEEITESIIAWLNSRMQG